MISRRTGATAGAILAGVLVLSSCSTAGRGETPGESSSDGAAGGDTQAVTITAAHEQEFNSYNNNTADQNAVQNVVILNQVLRGFWNYGPDGDVLPDEEFGTYEQTSEDPLTVQYTFADEAVWSDGEAIDCDDFLLTWAARSGQYASAEVDEETGNPLTGFSSASNEGYQLMDKPACADGDKEVEVTYTEPFADWNSMFAAGEIMPAHVVERESGVEDVIAAVEADDRAQLDQAATFYNTGFIGTPGEIDPEIYVSSGPYLIDSWQAGQSITLKENPEWWGTPPGVETVVVRFIEATQQATALQNGEIQVARPQPAQDILDQLEAIGDTAVVEQADEYTFEHMDFNFGGAFADPELRRAFALCLPRQAIVDTLIKPVNENAEVLNARYVLGFQPNYNDIVSAAYQGEYDQPDVAAAKAILDAKGAAGTVVRIGYQTPNQRRTDEVALTRDSCNQAGFDVQDAGQEDFFGNGLAAGNFDVALFAWSGSPLVSGAASTYVTGGGNNNGDYSNPVVDDLTRQLLTTPDEDAQTDLLAQIETALWADLATIPIFTFPGLQAHSADIEGPSFQPAQSQQTWNMNTWVPAAT